jgi:hypothetical protein
VSWGAPRPARRAPRLSPDQRIAPHITRRGRFLRVDPLQDRALPSVWRVLGVLGWAVLLEETMRRGRKRVRDTLAAGSPGAAGSDHVPVRDSRASAE